MEHVFESIFHVVGKSMINPGSAIFVIVLLIGIIIWGIGIVLFIVFSPLTLPQMFIYEPIAKKLGHKVGLVAYFIVLAIETIPVYIYRSQVLDALKIAFHFIAKL